MANIKFFILTLGFMTFIGAASSLMCYECYNENDNDECNGVPSGSNATGGEMVECSASLSNPTCHSGFKMNANNDGWVIQKGCMEYDFCYDLVYASTLLPGGLACFGNEPEANTECHMCCHFHSDGCNADFKYSWYVMPETNNWDSSVDVPYPPTTQAAPTQSHGDSGAVQHTAFIMSLLFTVIPCIL
ncbi:63 kDa sperm flagellar membrane protein-like [Antedon mediterranea]|uniref:63 kDa sperm flagellar membrane protein-like n=1 Tax=Antedon mediterranea TaxID=105859 RepID=UPI003AF83115